MPEDKTIIQLVKDSKGVLSCDVPISKDQWLDILRDRKVTSSQSMKVLLSFYFMPEHKATCAQCEEEYGLSSANYNIGISHFAQAVSNLFDFQIIDEAVEKPRYWPLPMGKGKEIKVDGKPQFEWQLREELVKALEIIVIDEAIESYLKDFDLYFYVIRNGESYNEKYKWQAVKWFQDNWDINSTDFAAMLDKALSKTENLLNSRNNFARGMIVELAQAAPLEVKEMFNTLYDESKKLADRVTAFIQGAEKVRSTYNPKKWKSHFQSTNAVSVYLWLRFPDQYYIYKYGEYSKVDDKLGFSYSLKRNGEPSEMVRGFEMYGIVNHELLSNSKARQFIESRISEDPTCYSDPHLNTATVDLGYYVSRRYKSLKNSLKSHSTSSMNTFISKAKSVLENKKNIILQGAPGTGKTYNTAALALSVLGINDIDLENHYEVMQKYDSLIGSQIFFTTFHQSMDYEDFIEGIKPRIQTDEDGNPTGIITYEPEDGIFKNACSSVSTDENYNIIEWIEDFIQKIKGFENKVEIPTMTGRSSFYAWWKDGNKTISTRSKNSTYSAGEERSPAPLNIQKIKDQAIGKGSENNWPQYSQALIEFVKQRYSLKREKPVVLIIDEINRGNISKIFGELITLIEKDKRLGCDHPVRLTLPYSKTLFGVPENLYIIGTMNTTDRSTGTIDYALRRRFAFLTVPSEKKHIESETGKKLFDSVKEFIEKFRFADMDVEDLMVGHSYFMADDDEELKLKVQYEIIPLIKEYIKDGILRVNPTEQKKYFYAWLELETLDDNDSGTSED